MSKSENEKQSAVVDRIYDTIIEWKMTPIEMIELAGRLSRTGLAGINSQVRESLGVPVESGPRPWVHLASQAADDKTGMTLNELCAFVELVTDAGVPGDSVLQARVGFGGQVRELKTRNAA